MSLQSPFVKKIKTKKGLTRYNAFFTVNKLATASQHAYREKHSTCMALTQMIDDWLRENDNKKIVGAVLLDFSAAIDIIDHSLLLEKHTLPFKSLGSLRNVLVFHENIQESCCKMNRKYSQDEDTVINNDFYLK